MKKCFTVLTAALILAGCCILGGCGTKGQIRVFDAAGQEIASLTDLSDSKRLSDNIYRAYLEIVLPEAEKILCDRWQCDAAQAKKKLLSGEYQLYTALDTEIYRALKASYESEKQQALRFGAAVTNLEGALLAVYSSVGGNKEYQNYATAKTQPYSSFKPLCVYTPAIENKLASWSQVYMDSPVKKLKNENGAESDWPQNAGGTYTNRNMTVETAIKKSINTVAVRCMQSVGVMNSISFLKERLALSLEFERSKAALYGEDEVIGNVALGYLYDGVSPVDMAGYYQIFANGGYYSAPFTVQKICDADGEIVYQRVGESKPVIKASTAYIMNRLLQNVVTASGTGAKAAVRGVPVGGKTGSGDNGYWFVGFTPQYTCAVWHGSESSANVASGLFSRAVSAFKSGDRANYPNCGTVKQAAYCCESGKLASGQCRRVDVGYYDTGCKPAVCDRHQ